MRYAITRLTCRLFLITASQSAALFAEPPRAVAPFDAAAARAHQTAWAGHLGTTVETTNSIGLKLVLIPPGEFLMGSTPEQIKQALAQATEFKIGADRRHIPNEGPQHRVVLTKPFRLSATEITVGQFRWFLESAGYTTETERLGGGNTHRRTAPTEYIHDPALSYAAPGYPVTDESPATQITWNDAAAFCNWLSRHERAVYRLPTEAEWEYACRAGTTTEYSCGDDASQLGDYAWYGKNSEGRSGKVGVKWPNPFGLFDMHGNTREWCADWYGAKWYVSSPTEDPVGPATGTGRVLRGGKWLNKEPYLHSAYRFEMWPTYRSQYFGFRVVCERSADAVAEIAAKLEPTRRVVYKQAGGRELQLHVFNPQGIKRGDRRPCFLVIHGGGWTGGEPRRMYPFAEHFARLGMVGISLQYRLMSAKKDTTVFDCVKDGRSAVRFIRSHADTLGVDPEKIIVSGASAGGHVAAGTALFADVDEAGESTDVSSIPNALVLLYPVIDTSKAGYGNAKIGDRWQELSPVHQVQGKVTPILIFHGTGDTVTPFAGAEAFRKAMEKTGNRCELVVNEGGKHGYLMYDRTLYLETLARTEEFLISLELLSRP